jgi:multidrug efflux pump
VIRTLVRSAAPVFIVVVTTLVFGMISYGRLPRESFPDVKIPVVLVSTPYIGVSPADVESLVTNPLENELGAIKDLKKMSSTSAEGVSVISLEFVPEVVIEDALQRVRDRVNRAKPELPDDAEEPNVQEVSFSDVPIMLVTIAGNADEEQLKRLGEALEEEIKRVPGVLDTRLSGGRERQIRVQVDPMRLAAYGLSLSDVSNALRGENVNIPGGTIGAGESNFLLRVPGEFRTATEIEAVAVKRVGDRPVFVRDLGRVEDDFADRNSYARMNGQAAVSVGVTKRVGANIIEIADAVKLITAEAAETWPEGVEYRVLADQSKEISTMISDLENNIITALILVVGVLVFAMGARNSLFVALTIPLSMFGSYIVIDLLGMTLNMVVLFSLILALGMLVDNGIVIVENIYRHMDMGKSLTEASIDGTSEVALAVAASTATTIAAFFPLVFWTGIMGQFMGFLPKVVIIVLSASLVAAVLLMPVMTARLMKRTRPESVQDPETVAHQSTDALIATEMQAVPNNGMMRAYRRLVEFAVDHRYLTTMATVGVLFISFIAYGALNHGTEFFPEVDPNRATIGVRTADGTELGTTDTILRHIEEVLAAEGNVDVYVAESGVPAAAGPFGGSQASPNQGRITIDFKPDRNDAKPGQQVRIEPTPDTIERIRVALAALPGAEITIDKERMGPPVGKPIAIEVSGKDFDAVGELAARVRRELGEIPGVTGLSDDYRVGRPELRLRIDRGAAQRVGASTADIGNALRTSIAGSKATALRDGTDEHDIVVEIDPRYKTDIQRVLDLRIPGRELTSPETFPVPLSTVARYELAGGSGAIRHIDQDLVVTINGDIIEGYNENAVRADVAAAIASFPVGDGESLRLGGADDEQRAAQDFLSRAFLLALALVALVLVLQFNSFVEPMIIMASVVLSIVGVLWGLILTGTPFGIIMTGIGVISLAGVVVNNAIVLLDYVGQLRARGLDVRQALTLAGMTRFRPVMLTATTTVLGLLPMALGITIDFARMRVTMGGSSAGFWGSMAIAVVFGLGFATILTLVVVPALYRVSDDIRVLASRIWSRLRGRNVAGAATTAALLIAGMLSSGSAQAAVSLDDAVAAAREHNVDRLLATERTVQTATLKTQAWSLVSPKVSAGASYTINEQEIALDFSENLPEEFQDAFSGGDPIIIQEKQYAAANISVIQPLFSGPALPALRGAYAMTEAAEADEASVDQRIRAAVARSWYGLSVAREAKRLADGAVGVASNHMKLAESQVNAGLAPARTALQARLAHAQALREQASAVEREVAASEAFFRMTGLPRDSELSTAAPPSVPSMLDDALGQARTQRPDLRAADTRIQVARNSKTAKAMGWLPTVDGRFTYSWSENTGFSDDPTTWLVVFGANWTLWDGGLRIAQMSEESSKLRAAELQARQLQESVDEQVRTAWARYQQSLTALESSRDERALAAENLRLAEAAFAAGSGTWLEVEDARLAQVQAELGALSQTTNRDLAAIDLRVAMGDW